MINEIKWNSFKPPGFAVHDHNKIVLNAPDSFPQLYFNKTRPT